MRGIEDGAEYLVDLWCPQLLPAAGGVADKDNARVREQEPQEGITFRLTGWRGAGWHMIFPDELQGNK